MSNFVSLALVFTEMLWVVLHTLPPSLSVSLSIRMNITR